MSGKYRRPLVALSCFALVPFIAVSSANATIWVGGNIDVHNNTGLLAHDFHVQGQIKSVTQPELELQIGYVGNNSFPSFVSNITHAGGDLWDFSADWSSLDVLPSEVGHFGLFFDVWSRNVWVELDGWWTDPDGDRIGGGWPIPGFQVPTNWWDPVAQQVYQFQGDEGNEVIQTELLQLDLMSVPLGPNEEARIEEVARMLNVDQMDQLGPWTSIPNPRTPVVDSFFDVFFDISSIPPQQPDDLLLARALVSWPDEPAGRWVFHLHQNHPVPEPATLVIWSLLGTLGVTIGWWRRRKAA